MLRSAIACPLLLLGIGCSGPLLSYRSNPTRVAEVAGTTLELSRADISARGGALVAASAYLRATSTVTFAQAWLSSSEADPCSIGVEPLSAGVGLRALELPAVVKEGDLLRLDFSLADGLRGETLLDIRTGTGECIRLPFSGETVDTSWAPVSDWQFGFGARTSWLLTPSSVVDRPSYFVLPIGRWFGRTRVWLEPGIGPVTRAFSDPSVSVAAHAEVVLYEHGFFGIGASAGYTVASAAAEMGAPEYRLLHAPRVALHLRVLRAPDNVAPGFPGGRQFGSWELAIPVDYWFGVGSAAGQVGPALGFALIYNQ